MTDAIARMAIYLAQAEPWVPDRFDRTGPSFKVAPKADKARIDRELNWPLRESVLQELKRGPATSEQIAKRLKQPQHLVSAKLSRLYRNECVERALDATSPHTERKVLRYWLRSA
jgi:DNA-binding transcriptional ArsR family regulator